MSTSAPNKPPMLVLLESLQFYRNVKIGAVAGVMVATSLYLVRTFQLLGPLTEVREYPMVGPEVWFLSLAFVLAATFALLVAVGLTIFEAARSAVSTDLEATDVTENRKD